MKKTVLQFRSKYRPVKSAFAALLAASLLLCGCGDSARTSDRTDTQQSSTGQVNSNNTTDSSAASDSLHYHATEKSIPDPQTSFENDPEYQQKSRFLSMQDHFSADGKLCFLYSILYNAENEDIPRYTDSYYLCVLEPPYEQWSCYTISSDYRLGSIVGISDEGAYLLAFDVEADAFIPKSIGFYDWDGGCRILDALDANSVLGDFALYPTEKTLYAVFNGSFTSYDEQFQPVLTQNLDNYLSGRISSDSGDLWYGFDAEQNLTVWNKPNGTRLFSLGNMVKPYSDFVFTKSSTGDFILADVSSIWTGNGEEPLKKILSFTEKGYGLQELLSLSANEDGIFSLIVRFDDNFCLLTLEPTDEPDKQEITLVSYETSINDVITDFNRQSDKYRITLINPYDDIIDFSNVYPSDYRRQLQMEISAGRGPDLVDSFFIDLDDYIRNGYIEPLDDIIENFSEYWPACLENGRTNGVLYGVPYRVSLSLLATSRSLAGNLETWTLEQMMDVVRESPAESLGQGIDSLGIVLHYGLDTKDNPQFIDYDAGVSHLTEQPFLDFLEFAKSYSDNLYYTPNSNSETADYYLDGRLAIYSLSMHSPRELLFASACFGGQDVLIGNPSPQGRGVTMNSRQLCLCSNSRSKEGAKEFLRYLTSEKGQSKLIPNTNPEYLFSDFSCRRDVTETILERYQINAKRWASDFTYLGVYVKTAPLDDTQIEQFWALFEDARPEWSCPSEILNIASEELEPYFAGDCSAEDAAWKLDNRVQLYLDEQK